MSQFDDQIKQHVWIGEFADDASATAWIKASNLDTNKDGTGDPPDWTQYGNTVTARPRYWHTDSWRNTGEAVQVNDFISTIVGDPVFSNNGDLVTKGS